MIIEPLLLLFSVSYQEVSIPGQEVEVGALLMGNKVNEV